MNIFYCYTSFYFREHFSCCVWVTSWTRLHFYQPLIQTSSGFPITLEQENKESSFRWTRAWNLRQKCFMLYNHRPSSNRNPWTQKWKMCRNPGDTFNFIELKVTFSTWEVLASHSRSRITCLCWTCWRFAEWCYRWVRLQRPRCPTPNW